MIGPLARLVGPDQAARSAQLVRLVRLLAVVRSAGLLVAARSARLLRLLTVVRSAGLLAAAWLTQLLAAARSAARLLAEAPSALSVPPALSTPPAPATRLVKV
ncbi:hypothetical protein GCM10009839_70850 [Catenulispora yoronensis]|uniref:Uncharacterized protein n=1 Tax=Catenulispora yoronensis TaxID=450799 RepID=A0ABN2V8P7_9ACTN